MFFVKLCWLGFIFKGLGYILWIIHAKYWTKLICCAQNLWPMQWYMSFETWYMCDRYFHLMDISFFVTSLNVGALWTLGSLFFFFWSFLSSFGTTFFQIKIFSLFKLRIKDKICIRSDKIVYRGFTFFRFSINTTPAQKTIWWNWTLTIISEKLCDGSKDWPTWFIFFCHHCIEYKSGVKT